MTRDWLFLAAYTCSGFAGLVYQATWARLFGLYLGHSTAAGSTVVATFMGGLSAGAWVSGRHAHRLTRRQALYAYALLEAVVIVTATAIPSLLPMLMPALWPLYADGAGSWLFAVVRAMLCVLLLALPAMSLGATFPLAVRWLGRSGALYAANTAGAAGGALIAGFILLPSLGHVRTIWIGAAASASSVVAAILLARRSTELDTTDLRVIPSPPSMKSATRLNRKNVAIDSGADRWPGFVMLAVTGFVTFLFEIAWIRLFAAIVGPSTYAFSAIVSAFISALALGSVIGVMLSSTRYVRLTMAIAIAGGAIGSIAATSYAGTTLPNLIVAELSRSAGSYRDLLIAQGVIAALLIMPSAIGLGAAFPLALTIATGGPTPSAQRAVGTAYAVNALASVAGSLCAGFLLVPRIGLQQTLALGAGLLLAAVGMLAGRWRSSRGERLTLLTVSAAGLVMLAMAPSWDRALLAAGPYNAMRRMPDGSPEISRAALTAGTLLFYREGATGTVSVKRLNGALSLAIDGKVDASTSADMLTQKVLAHLPLLLHDDPRRVAIVGLGSGVTLASALVHPVQAVDVVELSPEVVEASRHFAAVNRDALADRRTNLIIGDGRSHLLMSSRRYDVIVSEPSNPWMSGVAALFTREFFATAADRLEPGGILCQWAHTYNMSEGDLQSIVATFASVFPAASMWLIGDGDLLLVGAKQPGEIDLRNLTKHWNRPGVREDLAAADATGAFSLQSLLVGGPAHMTLYAKGADIQTDDRMRLEFSGPLSLFAEDEPDNSAALRRLRDRAPLPDPIAQAMEHAGATEWRGRGLMMQAARANGIAYEDFARAIALDPRDDISLTGLVDAALATRRIDDAESVLKTVLNLQPRQAAAWTALSRLLAAGGRTQDSLQAAAAAADASPTSAQGLEQLASIYSDIGDISALAGTAARLRHFFPERAAGRYYSAAAEYLSGRIDRALELAQQATTMDPKYGAAQNLRGAILSQLGRFNEARAAFTTALALDPMDASVYVNFGIMEMAAGDRPAAAGLFAEALAVDPSSEAARQGLAEAAPSE